MQFFKCYARNKILRTTVIAFDNNLKYLFIISKSSLCIENVFLLSAYSIISPGNNQMLKKE